MLSTLLFSQDKYDEQEWGLAGVLRNSTISFKADESSVSSFLPLMFFENKYFFLDGHELGIKAYETAHWRFSAIGRARFVDIPSQ